MYGWTGKVLRVDLTNQKVTKEDDSGYADKFIGGVGFGAKIYWDEVSPDITAYDPENRLILMPGPAGGTLSPSSGRFEVMTKIPGSYPFEQYCRSGCGGSWGPELKLAGYDGLIIQGKADKPVYLWIHDDKVEIKDASELWGQGTFITNTMIKDEHGKDIQIAAIGQAGENMASTATINVGRNAAGQGGCGAVMGSKNLKAIAVKGTGIVPVADPDELTDYWLGVRNYLASNFASRYALPDPDATAPDGLGPYGYKKLSCSAACPAGCVDSASKVPAPAGGLNEAFQRCSTNVQGVPGGPYTRSSLRGIGNDWGINLYEVGLGIVPWLRFCCNAGYLHDVGGVVPPMISEDSPMHPSKDPVDCMRPDNSYEHIFACMKTISFKEGDLGEILAKGALRARDELGFGTEFLEICFHKDGFNDHCGSRWSHAHHYPFWIWAALSRSMYHRDTADHITHGICGELEARAEEYGGNLSWEQMNEAAQYLWGESSFTHDYKNKERLGFWFHRDCQFLISLVLCDWLYRYRTIGPDGVAKFTTPHGKNYEFQDLSSTVYNLVTGKSIDREECLHIGERIWNLERAIYMREGYQGRQGGWFTKTDEAVIPYFVKWGDVHDCIHMDAVEYRALMDRYYTLAGWDVGTGMPKRATYERLGLKYVADELQTIGKLP